MKYVKMRAVCLTKCTAAEIKCWMPMLDDHTSINAAKRCIFILYLTCSRRESVMKSVYSVSYGGENDNKNSDPNLSWLIYVMWHDRHLACVKGNEFHQNFLNYSSQAVSSLNNNALTEQNCMPLLSLFKELNGFHYSRFEHSRHVTWA